MATTITRIPTATLADDPSAPASDPIPKDWNSSAGWGVEPTKAESSESVYGDFPAMYQADRVRALTAADLAADADATVASISPATGTTAGGTVTTSTGTNLLGLTGVTFGGTAATAVSATNATHAVATTPAHAAGAVSVVYTDNSGTVTKTTFFTYVAPTATGISPATGAAVGGTATTITGTLLTGATGVTFGGTAGTAFTVVSATSITVTSPAHAAGAVNVVIAHPGGNMTLTGAFTYT